ncbi:MAG: phage holin family protein [Novosphingobium sp.]
MHGQSDFDRPEALPLFDELRQIGEDARTYAEAELAFQKSRAAVAAAGTRDVALLGLAGFVLMVFALVGLTVGALLALTPALGALGATGVVVGLLVLVALICLWSALKRWRAMKAILAGAKDAA